MINFRFFKKIHKEESGITLYLAILILSSVIVTASLVNVLIIGEFRISGDIEESMNAINVAGSGLEATLYATRKGTQGSTTGPTSCVTVTSSLVLPAGSTCDVEVNKTFTDAIVARCTGSFTCTKVLSTGKSSAGLYRKIQAVYQNR
ncbi:hypothetical protein HY249_01005 [Candidatus Azambacteria bacterium]|nr:hypothetical protein [Candidatus Azambacteria bacterium]